MNVDGFFTVHYKRIQQLNSISRSSQEKKNRGRMPAANTLRKRCQCRLMNQTLAYSHRQMKRHQGITTHKLEADGSWMPNNEAMMVR